MCVVSGSEETCKSFIPVLECILLSACCLIYNCKNMHSMNSIKLPNHIYLPGTLLGHLTVYSIQRFCNNVLSFLWLMHPTKLTV
jgi:hypothetical protein